MRSSGVIRPPASARGAGPLLAVSRGPRLIAEFMRVVSVG